VLTGLASADAEGACAAPSADAGYAGQGLVERMFRKLL
jgi:hypothetical protein